MENYIFKGADVLRLMPQREPIVMVDTLVEADNGHAVTALTITPDNIFVERGAFTESGLIEHQAQSASVMVGYQAYLDNRAAPVGFIGEVKKASFFIRPKAGDTLSTTISVVSVVGDITIIKASTSVDNTTVAECQMKIFIEPDRTE